MKYYYLLNGKIMSANEKMPMINEQWHIYNANLLKWSSSIQPCDISESELEKILEYLNKLYPDTYPIEVTDIVEEKVTHQLLSMPPIDCYELFFKPKQVEEIEAVEFAECKKVFIIAEVRKLLTEMNRGDISFSRMVELMNEKAFNTYRK